MSEQAHSVYNPTILIVEDHAVSMKLMKDILEYHKYNVLEAHTGLEGLDLALKEAKMIKLIILDIKLPEINGLEILKILKSKPVTSLIPVMVISACAMGEEVDKAKKAGCNCYLTKPIDISEFLQGIKVIIENN